MGATLQLRDIVVTVIIIGLARLRNMPLAIMTMDSQMCGSPGSPISVLIELLFRGLREQS